MAMEGTIDLPRYGVRVTPWVFAGDIRNHPDWELVSEESPLDLYRAKVASNPLRGVMPPLPPSVASIDAGALREALRQRAGRIQELQRALRDAQTALAAEESEAERDLSQLMVRLVWDSAQSSGPPINLVALDAPVPDLEPPYRAAVSMTTIEERARRRAWHQLDGWTDESFVKLLGERGLLLCDPREPGAGMQATYRHKPTGQQVTRLM